MTVPAPLIFTSVSAFFLGILPFYRTYQLHKAKALENMSLSEQRINIVIITAISLLHLSEAIKSVFFGLSYYNQDSIFGVLSGALIGSAAVWLSEFARIVVIAAIILRTADFLIKPTDPPATRYQPVYWLFALLGVRIIMPFIVVAAKVPATLFGSFAGGMMILDVLINIIVTVAVIRRVYERRQKELLPAISNAVLFSNAIVTGLNAALELFTAVLMLASASRTPTSDFELFIQCLPSIGALVQGIMISQHYWNVKEILIENSPTGNSPRRVVSQGLGRNVFTF